MIDFTDLALSPNESRAARNYLGLSQAQAATKSNLPAHKLKRFETGNYVPDTQFLDELRAFYEAEGFNFHDERAPGAKARSKGDVFPAGVVGDTDDEHAENQQFPLKNQGKPRRPQAANVQFMRIAGGLTDTQVDQILDCIDENEEAVQTALGTAVQRGFLSEAPTTAAQVHAIVLLRRLAENGLLHAKLLGRDVLPTGSAPASIASAKTVGDLLDAALGDMLRAVVAGDKEAAARRKGRGEPSEVLEALAG